MQKINLNQLTREELAELEQLADHTLFECRNCGNQKTRKKCLSFYKLRELERNRQVICQQAIKRVESCRNLHIENECLEYSAQYCWHNCEDEGMIVDEINDIHTPKICFRHWKMLKK